MFSVCPFARVPQLKPVVADWLLSEWPGWYGPGGQGTLKQDIEAYARSESVLPVGLVAYEGTEPIGFGALKAESIPSHNHLSPWAAAGYVLPERRGRGVGAQLLQAIVAHAAHLGYSHVYCGTSTATRLMRRAGWQKVEQVIHDGKPLVIFRREA